MRLCYYKERKNAISWIFHINLVYLNSSLLERVKLQKSCRWKIFLVLKQNCRSGGIGIRARLKIASRKGCGFKSHLRHKAKLWVKKKWCYHFFFRRWDLKAGARRREAGSRVFSAEKNLWPSPIGRATKYSWVSHRSDLWLGPVAGTCGFFS